MSGVRVPPQELWLTFLDFKSNVMHGLITNL